MFGSLIEMSDCRMNCGFECCNWVLLVFEMWWDMVFESL